MVCAGFANNRRAVIFCCFMLKTSYHFLKKPPLLNPRDAAELSPQVLAYAGDAVFELYVRTYLIETKGSAAPGALHRLATDLVRAGGQAALLKEIQPLLTEEESRWVKRGRNSGGRVPKGATVGEYRHATGLEALLGFLYLAGKTERLEEIMDVIIKTWNHTQGNKV
jgi:ribonuclease III family protein